jgi:CheY-like chemotaxis protein
MAKKLLLADDSITIQKVVSLTFAEEDYDVICVGNGEIAIEKIKELHPDVVLADIFMPRQTGYEVCEFVKSDPDFQNIPVLLLVGTFEPFDKQEAARVGADGYLTKPFETTVLVQLVNDAVTKAGQHAGISPQPAEAAPAGPAPEPTIQVPAAEGAGQGFAPAPPAKDGEDVLDTPDFAPSASAEAAFEATIISSQPTQAEEDLGPEEILLADDEVAVPPSVLKDEVKYAPPAPQESESAGPDAGPAEEEVLDLPAMDARVTRPTEEDILGVFDLIHLDEIIARQKSLEESAAAEAAESVEPEPAVETVDEEEVVIEEESAAEVADIVVEEEEAAVPAAFEAAEEVQEGDMVVPTADADEEPAAVAPAVETGGKLDEQMVTRIAEMVVERLSERIIREIAWEVVPDLAELLIRQEINKMKEEGKI